MQCFSEIREHFGVRVRRFCKSICRNQLTSICVRTCLWTGWRATWQILRRTSTSLNTLPVKWKTNKNSRFQRQPICYTLHVTINLFMHYCCFAKYSSSFVKSFIRLTQTTILNYPGEHESRRGELPTEPCMGQAFDDRHRESVLMKASDVKPKRR